MKKFIYFLIGIFILSFLSLGFFYLKSVNIPILEPKGLIAQKELDLIYFALILALFVVIPVFSLLIIFLIRYREGNKKSSLRYNPNLSGSKVLESIWWVIPTIIILILSIVTWQSSYQLDPFKPISSNLKPLNIEVVALDWRWLFIYPDQNIASINFLEIPIDRPISFYITSDAPMNSFWIPQLAGQIYAMPGMSTQLHIEGNTIGEYNGRSANISGNGFSKMNFKVMVSSNSNFSNFINHTAKLKNNLSLAVYNKLSQPSLDSNYQFYSSVAPNLYNYVVEKYMSPNYVYNSSNISNMGGMKN